MAPTPADLRVPWGGRDRLLKVAEVAEGWVNRRQQAVIDYLIEENRVLREQLRGRRMWFTDDQRRRLARKGRLLARRVLDSLNTIVTPNTILRWYRELVAKKYDGTRRRRPGRPPTTVDRPASVGHGFAPTSASAG